MAIVFLLALLVDSACAAACVPAELRAPAKHCSTGHGGDESPVRGCDRHGHLKPVVQDRGFVAPTTPGDESLSFESPSTAADLESFRTAPEGDAVFEIQPLLQRNPVLRI